MSLLISVAQLKKAFGARALFEGLSFSVFEGERIGLIGPNGVGKSTLLKILAARESADSGQVVRTRGVRVGFLEQEPVFVSTDSAREALERAFLTNGDSDAAEWERIGAVDETLSRFEIDGSLKISEMSGGQRKRVALAREAMLSPDLLLLDEPTNHLDLDSIRWLERYLAQARFASITVTHDRLFLDRVANRIIEIHPRNPNGILSVNGGYADFLETQESFVAQQQSREQSLSNTLRRETEWLRRGAKARTTKQQARIHRAGDLADEVQDLKTRNREFSVKLGFGGNGDATEGAPKKLIDATGISKSYLDRTVVPLTDVRITPRTRLGILGRNGSGKSTLIRMLTGDEKPDTGSVFHSEKLRIALFEQNRGALDPEKTLMKTLCPTGDSVTYRGNRVHIRSYLSKFLFTPQQMEMPVGKLSGGEQARVLLALLMLEDSNLLVLDEPTNDLDFQTLDVLMEALESFPGAVILVSHDRFFLDQVSNQLLAFCPDDVTGEKKLLPFADYYQWESWSDEDRARQEEILKKKAAEALKQERASAQAQTSAGLGATGVNSAPVKARKLSYKEQRELDGMESVILEHEAELETLSSQSTSSEVLKSPSQLREVMQKMHDLQLKIDCLYARWSDLTG